MGPRSADRGNGLTPSLSISIVILQWGRDQLIAEMPALRQRRRGVHTSMGPRSADRGNALRPNGALRYDLLQWGRDQLIAEMRLRIRLCASALRTSMGPRSADRGNRSSSGHK